MRPQPLISVTDVRRSSLWYQALLRGIDPHGGSEYARLFVDGILVLQLHAFGVDHDHGPIGDPADRPYGNGVLLWFELDDFDDAMDRIARMRAEVIRPKRRNPRPDHWECWLRDPDAYTVVLASPDDSAKIR
jgi:hypothetical protein